MSATQTQSSRQISDGELSWPIFIISLTTATARRASCKAAMDRLGLEFEFFDAVRGSDLSEEQIARVYDADKNAKVFKRPLSKPEIGCYLSHHALWDRIGKSRDAGAIVLEDDFDADGALPALLGEICRLDLSNCMVKLHSEKKVAGASLVALAGGRRLLAPTKTPGMTLGYVIERQAAARLAGKIPSVRATGRHGSQALVGFRRLRADRSTHFVTRSQGERRKRDRILARERQTGRPPERMGPSGSQFALPIALRAAMASRATQIPADREQIQEPDCAKGSAVAH